jgi:hypothetical protein
MREITNVALEPGDAAVSALSSPQPIVKNDQESAATLTGIYSALGGRKKIGVLYLETPQGKPSEPPSEDTLGIFQVIQKALSDVLLLD